MGGAELRGNIDAAKLQWSTTENYALHGNYAISKDFKYLFLVKRYTSSAFGSTRYNLINVSVVNLETNLKETIALTTLGYLRTTYFDTVLSPYCRERIPFVRLARNLGSLHVGIFNTRTALGGSSAGEYFQVSYATLGFNNKF